jgi:predicted O-linked N-acetylglucosamine transferase (SPINDLY family)
VVTLAGRQFAARVCASLLEAIGLPELVTETEQDYEALSLALASEPDGMAALRVKLEANRLTKPLFDTNRYVRNLEAALVQVHESRVQGLAA